MDNGNITTIEFARDLGRWLADLEGDDPNFWLIFQEAARNSKLHWEALDFFQAYTFKVIYTDDGPYLRFLGIETQYDEWVPATKDQLVLRNPA
jgi:hypothetical protein